MIFKFVFVYFKDLLIIIVNKLLDGYFLVVMIMFFNVCVYYFV